MPFRDEEEALRARLAEVESQRDEARAEAARLSGARTSRSRYPWLLAVGTVAFSVGFLLGRRDAPALQRQLDGARETSAMYEHEAKRSGARVSELESRLQTEAASRRMLEEALEKARAATPAPLH